jgi:hypothetical protein
MPEKRFWACVLLLFALLSVLIYLPALTGKVPFPRDMVLQFAAWNGFPRSDATQHYADIGDLVTQFYPSRLLQARAMHEGGLALWNPYFLGGATFVGNPQSSLFYPPNLLYYVLSVPTAWTLCLMLRVFLSGVFMTLFVRSIGGSGAGSIFSGLVFSLCGFVTAWQGQPMADGAAWLPMTCYAVIRLQKWPGTRSLALAALAFAMPVLAGHPETAAHVTLAATAVALFTWISNGVDTSFLGRFTLAGLLAVALSSIQIVPTLEWLSQMPTVFDLRWPVLPLRDAFGWVSRDVARTPNSAGLWIPESAAYVGLITLLAAPVGLFHRNARYAVFLASLTAVALGIAYGFAPLHWLVNHTPVLAALKNSRMVLLGGFGFAALAGLGISALQEDVPFKPGRRLLALAMVSVAVVLIFLLIYKLRLATTFRVEFFRRPSFSRSLLFISAIPILWRLHGGLRGRLFPIVACAVIAFDLITVTYGYAGFSRRDEIFPRSPSIEFLEKQSNPGRYRIISLGTPFPPNTSISYGFAAADGYEVKLIPPQLAFSLDFIDNSFSGLFFIPSKLLKLNDRRLDMLNVKYLAAVAGSPEYREVVASKRYPIAYNDGSVAYFENTSVLPRAWIVPAGGIQVLPGADAQLQRLRDAGFDPRQTVLLSQTPASLKDAASNDASSKTSFTSDVAIRASRINDVVFNLTASEPAVLVVSQTFYPGWKAMVDGRAAEVFAADLNLTGIALPAGSHEVRLAFRPFSVQIGAVLTAVGVFVLIVLMRTHKRRSGPTNNEIQQIRNMTVSDPLKGLSQ